MQERSSVRLGGMETLKVDVRIIAATNVDLNAKSRKAGFAKTCSIACTSSPSTRRRCASARTTSRCSFSTSRTNMAPRTAGPGWSCRPTRSISLMEYDWAGNVRELENVIERATVLAPGQRIGLIPEHVRRAPTSRCRTS